MIRESAPASKVRENGDAHNGDAHKLVTMMKRTSR
jgi:hypothetical protein